jgi:hypothetical protein
MSKSEFEQRFEPYVEFKWTKFSFIELHISKNNSIVPLGQTKQHELLYNYNRYRELVDTVELYWEDEEKEKWYNYYSNTGKVWAQGFYRASQEDGTRYFSTEAHAQAFLKLAQENDCL